MGFLQVFRTAAGALMAPFRPAVCGGQRRLSTRVSAVRRAEGPSFGVTADSFDVCRLANDFCSRQGKKTQDIIPKDVT